MNSEKFIAWLRGQLIPNLPPKSVVVINNALYHTVLEVKCPTKWSRKADMVDQEQCRHGWPGTMQRGPTTWLELCRTHRPLPTLKQHGHTMIQLPPYYAELNSIELILAMQPGALRMTLTLPVTVAVVKPMTIEQTQRARDMKRREMSLLFHFVDCD